MKRTILILMLTIIGLTMKAKPVEPNQAILVARNFMAQYVKGANQHVANVVYTHRMPKSGRPGFYAVNIGNSAFVLVSADDVATPVLGYSTSHSFPDRDIPAQILSYYDDLVGQIESVLDQSDQDRNIREGNQTISSEWRLLIAPTEHSILHSQSCPDSVGPLLTTTWNQGQYYNALCPSDFNDPSGHAYAGCVATAMAQIINYWEYPLHGRGIHSYETDYGSITVNYDSATYDYNNMPNELTSYSTTAQINAVASLMRDCGVALNTIYGPYGSSVLYTNQIRAALVNHFKYSPNLAEAQRAYYTDLEWFELIKNNIDNQRPVLYSGLNVYNGVGHVFIIDGYNNDDYFHFNFGWSGFLDGWYKLTPVSSDLGSIMGDGMGFIYNQTAFFDVMPDSTSNILYAQNGLIMNIDSPIELYNINGNNLFRGNNEEYQILNDVMTFYSEDTTKHLVVDIIDFNFGGAITYQRSFSIYDGTITDSLLKHVLVEDFVYDLSPVVSSSNVLTIEASGFIFREGFRIRVSQEDDCRTVSDVSSSLVGDSIFLEWHENGNATQWRVEYGPHEFYPGEGVSIIADTTIAIIYDTSRFSTREFHIQPICDTLENNHYFSITVNKYVAWTDVVNSEPEGYYIDSLGAIHIYTPEGLAWISKKAASIFRSNDWSYLEKIIIIESDIDLSEYLWTPIVFWRGNIYGNGHVISNMYIKGRWGELFGSGLGLFGELSYVDTIIDLGFNHTRIIYEGDGAYAGTIAGISGGNTNIINCYSTDYHITSITNAGGLVGNGNVFFNNCYTIGYAYAFNHSGGIAGYSSTMRNCYTSFRGNYGLGPMNYWSGSFCSIGYPNNSFENCFADIDDIQPDVRGGFFVADNQGYSAHNLSGFSRSNGQFAYTVPDSISENYTYDGPIDLVTALNSWVIDANSPIFRTWEWDSITALPKFGDYYEVTCPNVTNVSASNIPYNGGYGMAISWEDNGSADEWVIKCLPYGALNDDSAVYFTSYSTSDTLTGLMTGMVYSIFVSPVCQGDSSMHWGNGLTHLYDKPYWVEIVTSCPNGYIDNGNGNIIISSAEGLAWMAVCSNGLHGQPVNSYEGDTIHIIENINLEQYKWMPIGWIRIDLLHSGMSFNGTLLGHNHIISNLYCNEDERVTKPGYNNVQTTAHAQYLGLIGNAGSAEIRDLMIDSAYLNGGNDIGSLVGRFYYSKLFNCHVRRATVTGKYNIGGLIGSTGYYSSDDPDGTRTNKIINTSATGVVRGDQGIGGIIGYGNEYDDNRTLLANSYANVEIQNANRTEPQIKGGLAGIVANAANCYSAGRMIPSLGWFGLGYAIGIVTTSERNVYAIPSDGYSFSESQTGAEVSDISDIDTDMLLVPPVTIDSVTYSDLLLALNAWVDANNTEGIYRHWATDTANVNGGFPVFAETNNPPCVSTTSRDTITACNSYFWHGIDYAVNTELFDFLRTTNGCDSIVAHYLVINHSTIGSDTITACDSYNWNDIDYTVNTELVESLSTISGCDSIVTHHLVINHSISESDSITTCDGYTWNGVDYTINTELVESLSTISGCDSIVTHHLVINHSISEADTLTACDVYTWNGVDYTINTELIESLSTMNGCDSIMTHYLVINYSATGTDTITACDSYTWNGVDYTVNTELVEFLSTINGCDSIVTHHLIINHSISETDTVTACDVYTWDGINYTVNTELIESLSTINGCDSIMTHYLVINHSTSGTDTISACDSYTWHGVTYTISTDSPTYETVNSVGCDSTVTLCLTINYSTESTITDTADGSYSWNGETYTESGTYTWTGTTINGCDSIINLHLVINQVGIYEIENSLLLINIYPNPTTGVLFIDADDILSIEAFSINGQKVRSINFQNQKIRSIDLDGLPTGEYLLKIYSQQGIVIHRVILK